MSWHQAAIFPTAWMTSHHAIFEIAELKPGETIMIHAAGSGVSMAGIQWAKNAGARVLATAGSEEKCAKALELGADYACNNRETKIADWARNTYWMLVAAIDLGVFDLLEAKGKQPATSLANDLAVSEVHLTHLLDCMVTLDFLDQVDKDYELTETAERYLCSDSVASMASLVRVSPGPLENWMNLAETIRLYSVARAQEEKVSGQLAAVEMLRSGTTSFLEAGTINYMDEVVEGLGEVAHCPTTALKVSYGITQIGKFPEMVKKGINVSIGTDGNNASNYSDLMRATYLVAGLFKDARRDPQMFPAEIAFEMATLGESIEDDSKAVVLAQ
eukprot:g4261.t1